jgi:hypothetical protein
MTIVVHIDDYSPIRKGDTGNRFIIQVIHENGYEDLSGATLSMTMQNVDDPDTIKVCNGSWSIDSVNTYKASYQYQPEDVDEVGNWYMWVKIVKNGVPIHPDDGKGEAKILEIKPLPDGV